MLFKTQKITGMTSLLIVLTILFSCSKDSDLLLDTVLSDSDTIVEEKNGTIEEPSNEEGFVLRTFTFSPTNDAYLQDTQGHDKSIIRLEEDFRTSYLMFDLSQINGPIIEATLQLSVDSDEGDGIINIHKGISNDWSEENLNENNASSIGAKLGQLNKEYTIGSPEKLSLNATELQAEITTIILKHSTGNDLAFASKENIENTGPRLTVKYKATEGSPYIEQEPEEIVNTEEDDNANEQTKNNNQGVEIGYYVTTSGKSTNNGLTEATAWSIDHAFEKAVSGDIVYIKAGNYGNKQLVVDNSGTSNMPIKFIGYTNSPGDLVSNEGSTFEYGDQLDPNKMPLIKGINNTENIGLEIPENYIELENIQISNYRISIFSRGTGVKVKNIISTNNGQQNNDNSQTGKSFQIYGDITIIENCFILNANSEGINIKGANNCIIKSCKVFSDNLINMTGYYILIAGGGKNNVIENCQLYRDDTGDNSGLPHQGHGYVLKDQATNNIIRNSSAINTGIETNFSGVFNNTFENITITGNFSTYDTQHSACIKVINGAHDNKFKDIIIKDTRYGIVFVDFDDGYVGPDGDRDKKEGGHNNKFINVQVDKGRNCVAATSAVVGATAFSNNNQFLNCSFKNISGNAFFSYQKLTGNVFSNCSFANIPNSKMIREFAGGSFITVFENCTFSNIGFPKPN